MAPKLDDMRVIDIVEDANTGEPLGTADVEVDRQGNVDRPGDPKYLDYDPAQSTLLTFTVLDEERQKLHPDLDAEGLRVETRDEVLGTIDPDVWRVVEVNYVPGRAFVRVVPAFVEDFDDYDTGEWDGPEDIGGEG